MPKLILYIATSLDGYIAGPNHELDWLDSVELPGEDYGYARLMEDIDTLIMGRGTYEVVRPFGEWPYRGKDTYILSNSLSDIPEPATLISGDMAEVISHLKAEAQKDIWLVGGGEVIRQCLERNLIDEFIISVIPVLLGEGLPLFPPAYPQLQLSLVDARSYDSGLVLLTYRPQ